MKHITKRVANRVSMSLSSFLSNVLLLEGTFIVFIITCNVISNICKTVSMNNHSRKIKSNKRVNKISWKGKYKTKLIYTYKKVRNRSLIKLISCRYIFGECLVCFCKNYLLLCVSDHLADIFNFSLTITIMSPCFHSAFCVQNLV